MGLVVDLICPRCLKNNEPRVMDYSLICLRWTCPVCLLVINDEDVYRASYKPLNQ